ncbi:MAG: metal-sensitive transcriptional regulator [Tissierellia bacterium]|jgi:DNA-binding FrmR family transcriptional regulator|nr:metal-sensitive transcriptional regulator [Tissierellia bacterium]
MEKKAVLNRLRTLQGHMGGIITMLEEDKPCEEVLVQMKAVSSSFSKIQSLIFEHYLDQCIELTGEDREKIRAALKLII